MQWKGLVDAYLSSRPALAGIVVIMDARHPFTRLDEQLLDWLGASAPSARPSPRRLTLLSKADKLSRAEQAALKKKFSNALLFSSVTRQGVEECRDLLEGWLQQAAEIKSPR
jgi:GTP-binding protein